MRSSQTLYTDKFGRRIRHAVNRENYTLLCSRDCNGLHPLYRTRPIDEIE